MKADDEKPARLGPSTSRPRPGGRTERNGKAVYAAVIQAMNDQGLEFTYQDVADRSGVSRRTLHRRWPERKDLIADALRASYDGFEVTLSGRLDDDVREFAYRFRDFAMTPTSVMIDGLAALSPDQDFAQLSRAAFEQAAAPMLETLVCAAEKSQVASGIDMATIMGMLISPIVVSCSILRQPPTDTQIELLVDHVLRAAKAQPPAADSTAARSYTPHAQQRS
ncbi:TetR/AcrR family transcriptional regulator [Mycobacterium sp. MS1601]|uniref:TetR/AcrR family transcriptional regulator n=1 Tax=Mycobacterium sp. MS1601 TaxID=1936029 RepID=UPI00178CA6FC|nr:TetR/AcrR family transcriptional regulator C-terminal ligand-binding domain-containing protein [Mycobacterium sp. MS1601]